MMSISCRYLSESVRVRGTTISVARKGGLGGVDPVTSEPTSVSSDIASPVAGVASGHWTIVSSPSASRSSLRWWYRKPTRPRTSGDQPNSSSIHPATATIECTRACAPKSAQSNAGARRASVPSSHSCEANSRDADSYICMLLDMYRTCQAGSTPRWTESCHFWYTS